MPPLPASYLAQRPLDPEEPLPIIESLTPTGHPSLFRKRLGTFDSAARPGDLVRVRLNTGEHFGFGLFNRRAEISVRMLCYDDNPPDANWWKRRLEEAVRFRRETLRLDKVTNAYRVVHAEGDGLPGLIVDRFGDVLVVEAFSVGMYQRAEAILDILTPLLGTKHGVLRAAPYSLEHEGFQADPVGSEDLPAKATIQEYGTQFRVDFAGGHKTGFYCDQREHRHHLAECVAGKTVLDICCYTGGFAIQAKTLGQAADVVAIDLDPEAIRVARENAQLNKAKIAFTQGDAFPFLRDMIRNGRKFDAVVLDPPKLIRSREEFNDGKRKYFDLNRLASQLVAPGGTLVTCSCSGMLGMEEFTRLAIAALPQGRRGRILQKGGAAADHPIATNCPEGEYLKVVWIQLEEAEALSPGRNFGVLTDEESRGRQISEE